MEQNETVNRRNVAMHLLKYQLNMVDKTLEETLDDDKWFFNWTMTSDQLEEFKGYAIPLLKKTFKCSKKKAEGIFQWFNLQYGLRIKNKTK